MKFVSIQQTGSLLIWGANNDNGASTGWPIANGNCIANANNGSEVAAIFRVPAGTIISNLLCTYTNAAPTNSATYTVRTNGAGNTTMADTAIACTLGAKTINGIAGGVGTDTTNSVVIPDSGDGFGYISLKKSGNGTPQAGNYAGTFTLRAFLP